MLNFAPLLFQSATQQACTGLCQVMLSPYTAWFPVAIVITLLIMSILAVIYALSPLVGRNDLRVWVKAKLYDELSSIVLIMIFMAFAAMLTSVPVLGAFQSAGLAPSDCASAITSHSGAAVGYNNLYFLSECDLWSYNKDIVQLTYISYWVGMLVSVTPAFSQTLPPGSQINVTVSLNLLPIEPVFHYMVPLLNSLYIFYILVQVQYLLIGASGLIFGVLMVVGLVARSFGVTRTFGGAMIAFALGIGFVYPLMTSISYGFLDNTINVAGNNLLCNFGVGNNAQGHACVGVFIGGVMLFVGYLFGNMFTGGTLAIVTSFAGGAAGFLFVWHLAQQLLIYGALVSIGLTFIPLMNITVVDTFIVDFSRSVGERMDFISLLTRIM